MFKYLRHGWEGLTQSALDHDRKLLDTEVLTLARKCRHQTIECDLTRGRNLQYSGRLGNSPLIQAFRNRTCTCPPGTSLLERCGRLLRPTTPVSGAVRQYSAHTISLQTYVYMPDHIPRWRSIFGWILHHVEVEDVVKPCLVPRSGMCVSSSRLIEKHEDRCPSGAV